MNEIYRKISFSKKILLPFILIASLIFIGGVSLLMIPRAKSGAPSPKQVSTKPSKVTPLPLTVTSGKLAVQTLPAANVSLKFFTWEWKADPSSNTPNARTFGEVEIPDSAMTQATDSDGVVKFDLEKIPMNAEADVTVEKGKDRIHFKAALDPYFGAVFVVTRKDGVLSIDFEKTEFAPGETAGERSGPDTRKADQKASLTILE